MFAKPHRYWYLPALVAAVLLGCGSSGRELVGSWKGVGEMGYNQNVADFLKKAVETETEALSLLEKDPDLSDEDRQAAEERFRSRIDLYQGGQAYTEP